MSKRIVVFALMSSFSVFGKQSVTVTAEKIERSYDETTSNVQVIDLEEIEKSQTTNLADLIEKKSGLFVNSNGSYGKSTSLFLRGADSSFTLIVIDGVEYNDKSSVGGGSVLDHIDLSNVEKVEILKGSQSVLYGSDAMAGVINITTKNPKGTKEALGSVSYGSFKNKRASFSARNSGKRVDYSMGLSFQDVEGISSYNEDRVIMAEKDGYNNLTASFKATTSISTKDELSLSIRSVKAESDFDASTADKLDYVGRDAQTISSLFYKYKATKVWEPKLKVSHNKSDRLSNSFSLSRLVSKVNKVELENPFVLSKALTLLNGFEYEKTKASIGTIDNKKNFESVAGYLDAHGKFQKLSLHGGVRWTNESTYSYRVVWKIGASYPVFKKTDLKINASTGFKSPSLYQLYSNFGNTALSPTQSESFDLSITQFILSSKFELTYFNDNYDNIIDFDSVSNRYENISKADIEGFELNYFGESRSFDWKVGTTLLSAINNSTGKEGQYLPRRPRQKYNASLGWNGFEKFNSIVDFSYVGERENSDFDTIVLSSYFLVDLRFSYELGVDDKVLFKVGNLFDRKYEQVYGYGTPGINFNLTWKFNI
ncbi:TonB-dependent siderophore receptor [Halobacteriovorax sp. HLS]|uniref:TonB-dependent receptor plug domain-containing protein n=1 Tax=Halobacteriovorax sp. HLS TaxID=2234000 RepID=UPI000FD923E6|nr:TonB-dependent receptor [Halobacteriovorax sp. HLS]